MSQVRNSWRTRGIDSQTFLDAADWESIKRRGQRAVTRWIDNQLSGTGVTVVLIGEHTAERPYVRYEIQESHRRGNGLLGIFIHKLRDRRGEHSYKGLNPFTHMSTTIEESSWLWGTQKKRVRLSALYPVYDWVDDNGYENMSGWIENAARKAGR